MSNFFMEDLETKAIPALQTHTLEKIRPRHPGNNKIWTYTRTHWSSEQHGRHGKHTIHTGRGNKPDHFIPGHEHSPQRRRQHQNNSLQETHTHGPEPPLDIRTPTEHKLPVRTLLEQNSIITDDKDRQEEEKHIRTHSHTTNIPYGP